MSTWLPVLVVLAVVAAAFASFQYDLGERLGLAHDDTTDPAEVAPPPGLELPALTPPSPVAAGVPTTSPVDPAKVRRALASYAQEKDLGKHRVLAVGGLDGSVWYDNAGGDFTPASTMKLLTGTAALEAIGPDTTFRTTVVTGARSRDIVLVGGGDPFLTHTKPSSTTYPERADIRSLARETAAALAEQGLTKVRLQFDDSLFTGPSVNPHWPASYIPEAVVPPITALWVDKGAKPDSWGFESDPSQAAATMFAAELRRAGVGVAGTPRRTTAADDATEIAAVESAPVWQIVDRVISVSDNEGAEILSHQVGIAEGTGGSFAGGAKAVRAVLGRLGVPLAGTRFFDGSGLSREDKLTSQAILGVLATAAKGNRPELRTVVTALPVAGFTGSMTSRLGDSDDAGPGRVRAKTGTLTGVHGLAGVTTDLDGNVMTFLFLADRVTDEHVLDARDTLDDLTAALAACHCS
ncbi:D-alanyl-D-alanine carboxypeptidase/D-alanyl-D-alanine endopeptidase [Nocardioides jensenii]|uniref:D-alanyl-D-alanine carboxypeptidase/D-alanyl-D-alanine endopeptidase n=1 Tax=Nocardioides jensenii TaxID=1843 RepID=UPI0008346B96|nr:D-alanyl-D-alanine carboxypeptidase/D-alanyl-D-alanine-endopeptidase [Nocardioides jensenii]